MKRKALLGLIILLVVGGVFVWRFYPQESSPTVSPRTTPVRTMSVPRGSIVRTIEASGTISGARQANLSFALNGQVQKVLVTKGDYVTAGQILAEMESSQQELALLKAKNALELAKFEGTSAAIREREYDLEIAEANLAKTKIIAPFSGIVIELELEEGEAVSANSGTITLLDNSVFFANVTVDELDMSLIKLGQTASVKIDALGGKPLRGVVADIGWQAQASGSLVTVPVAIRIEGEQPDLRVGYSASVEIETARVDDVLKLPLEAVVRRGNESYVTVLRSGQEVPVLVETGLTDGREVEIISGLSADDQVVGFNFSLYIQGGTAGSSGFSGTNVQRQLQRIGGFGR